MADFREQSTDAAVKLSGVAAATTDASLVVAFSPNSPLPAGANTLGTVQQAALVKGTQGATGVTTQDLKDSGRVSISMTAEFSPIAATETLLSLSISKDGATPTTASSYVPTSGKRFRLTSLSLSVENTLGTSLQRAYMRYRQAVTGGLLVTSPLQITMPAVAAGTVKSIGSNFDDVPDGLEILGDGTKAIGFSLQAPDWVTASATLKVYVTVLGFEY